MIKSYITCVKSSNTMIKATELIDSNDRMYHHPLPCQGKLAVPMLADSTSCLVLIYVQRGVNYYHNTDICNKRLPLILTTSCFFDVDYVQRKKRIYNYIAYIIKQLCYVKIVFRSEISEIPVLVSVWPLYDAQRRSFSSVSKPPFSSSSLLCSTLSRKLFHSSEKHVHGLMEHTVQNLILKSNLESKKTNLPGKIFCK